MRQLGLICALVLMSGCAYYRVPARTHNNWGAVQRLPPGADVLVRAHDGKHTGQIETVTAGGLILREKNGLTSIARSNVVRLYQRCVFMDSRVGNSLWSAGGFMPLSILVAPFVDQKNAKVVVGIMAGIGAAIGATAKTSYRDSIVYVRR
jgi:hypothetical protein